MNAAAQTADRTAVSWRQAFRGEERELGRLRRWLRDLLPECEARDDVITVADELAANAVRYTVSGRDGWVIVEITRLPGLVRVAVADAGGPGEPRFIDNPMAEHGRGLHVVAALSAHCSVSGDHRGRLVCADVPWAGADAVAPAAPGNRHQAAAPDSMPRAARNHVSVTA